MQKKKENFKYYLIGSSYGKRSIYKDYIKDNIISIGFCWSRDLSGLYGKNPKEIVKTLKGEGFHKSEYSLVKHLLQMRPGDIIAIKSKGWPKGKKPCLEIIAYAMVVERDGSVYNYNPKGLGHCINIEFIEKDLDIDKKIGGYGQTIYSISKENVITNIFNEFVFTNDSKIRERIRSRRKATTTRKKGNEKRKGTKPYVADLKHNEIQESFYKYLKNKYPKDRITMEEDFVDVKRETARSIILYEVKPYAWAEDCIREGLGQLLSYAHQIKSKKELKFVVVGPYKASKPEEVFIEYVKNEFKPSFKYVN